MVLGFAFGRSKAAPISTRLDAGLDSNNGYQVPFDCIVGVHQIAGAQTYLEVVNRANPHASKKIVKFNTVPDVLNNDGTKVPLDRAVSGGQVSTTGQNISQALGYLSSYRAKQAEEGNTDGVVLSIDPKKVDPSKGNLAPYALSFRNPDAVTEMSVEEFWAERDGIARTGFQVLPVQMPKGFGHDKRAPA